MPKTYNLKTLLDLSFPDWCGELSVKADLGCLVLDKNFKVVFVNSTYQQFHCLFSISNIEAGKNVEPFSFSSLPQKFINQINTVISKKKKKVKLEIEYHVDKTMSFDVLLMNLCKPKDDVDGVCIVVKKNESKPTMPGFFPDDAFYKLLVNKSANVFQLADAGLHIIYSSEAVKDILGFTPKEIQGKNLIEFVHANDREKVRDWFFNVKRQSEKLLSLEYRIKNSLGHYIWIENNARNMLDNKDVRAIVMDLRNIQSKKVADDALSLVEQRLSLLLNNTDESFIVLNSRLRIITYNKAAQDLSPYFFKIPLQSDLSILDLIDEQENEEYVTLFEQVFSGNEIDKETTFTDEKGVRHVYNHKFRPLLHQ